MNANLRNGRTINSFLADQKSEVRQAQLAALDRYASAQKAEKADSLFFVKYWGGSAKGEPDKYEYDALLNLFGFLRVVEKEYKMNVQLTLVFTDTHVLLNGYSRENSLRYYKRIRSILNKFNYCHTSMSEVIKPYLRQEGLENIDALIISIVNRSKTNEVPLEWSRSDSFQVLKRSASKYSCRLLGSHFPEKLGFETIGQAARAYVELNKIEADQIAAKFSGHIFLTYMSGTERELVAPPLPAMQLFSYRSGIRSRPWFSYQNTETLQPCAVSLP